MDIIQKYFAKEMRASILVRYVISGEKWLHDFGGISVFYLSGIQFEQLVCLDSTECRPKIIFVSWCIIKLDFNLCRAFLIRNVNNDISRLGRKLFPGSEELVI